MRTIHGTATIRRPAQRVFEFVTTAGGWPRWYPITRRVEGTIDGPGQPGDHITEYVRLLGFPSTFYWTIDENIPAQRYVFSGTSNVGGKAKITYQFREENGATRFDRRLEYEQTNLLMKLADCLILQFVIRHVSATALRNAQHMLESEV